MSSEHPSPAEFIEAHQRRIEELDEHEQITLAPNEGELEFWDKIMRSPRQPMQRRMKAAELGAQYKYAKLGAIAVGSMNGKDFASMLERAIRASGKEAEVKQIESRAITSEKSG
jgi:hypothetical protein